MVFPLSGRAGVFGGSSQFIFDGTNVKAESTLGKNGIGTSFLQYIDRAPVANTIITYTLRVIETITNCDLVNGQDVDGSYIQAKMYPTR